VSQEEVLVPNGMSPLLSLPSMDADRDRIEDAMHAAVVTPDAYLTEIASHLIVAGGKRLRPVLSVVAAQIAGDRPTTTSCEGVWPASWSTSDRCTTTT
jgi:geranylgeranyl pyrophosphate synthase